MDYRTGKCSQCGAEYKVPASFAHNVARCKKCQGVVHLGPAPAAAAPAAAKEPPASGAIPAKRVVPKPEAARPAAPEARKAETSLPPRPAAPPKPAAASPTPPKGGTLERLKTQREGSAPAAAPAPEPRPVAASAARRKHEKEEGGEAPREKRAGRAAHAHEKKKAPVAGILSIVGLVVIGGALILFREQLFGGGQPVSEAVAGAPAEPAAPAPAPSAQPLAATPADDGRAPAAPAEEAPPAAAAEKPKAESKAKDPASIDLAAIPDFQPTPDTTPEDWAKMNAWVEQWMDVDAGAAGNRAKMELVKRTRQAVPAILNAFKKLDFATKEGRSNGDQCQKALQQICNGTNFDWKYADAAAGRPYDHPDDVWFCKRVVELWANSWKQAEQDIKAWIKIAKLEEKDPAEAKRLLELFGSQSAEPAAGGDDELEVD